HLIVGKAVEAADFFFDRRPGQAAIFGNQAGRGRSVETSHAAKQGQSALLAANQISPARLWRNGGATGKQAGEEADFAILGGGLRQNIVVAAAGAQGDRQSENGGIERLTGIVTADDRFSGGGKRDAVAGPFRRHCRRDG